jgi:glyoxylase I family protein
MRVLRAKNVMLEIIEYIFPRGERQPKEPWQRGYAHFCVDVTDIDGEYERLKALGMTFHGTPPPRGAIDVRAIYGRDPEGNIIELQEIFSTSSPFYLDTIGTLES